MKSTAVAAVAAILGATVAARGSYISTPAAAGLLSSNILRWIVANVIILWLLSSFRRSGESSSAGQDGHDDILSVVDDLYPSSSEYEAVAAVVPRGEAAPPASRRQLARDARTARTADRPRVRKKPSASEQEMPKTVAMDACRRLGGEKPAVETPGPVAAAGEDNDAGDVSMDSLWDSIVQRRAARPVAVRKSGTWSSDELPRLQRVAETAAARREMRKSVSAVAPPSPAPAGSMMARHPAGWRTWDALGIAPDELLRRAESFIRRQHEHLRLQRQESEQRQALELQRRRPAAALIRV
ncbi:hypothetical protein ACP4OV_010730 [Aristida adscensionis]